MGSITKLLNPTLENIKIAVAALLSSDVIGLPTETVYGLAGNAFDDEAIAKIFFYKSRPSFDPLIVHVSENLNSCEALAKAELINISAMTPQQIKVSNQLMELYWPGPLTIIFPKHSRISDLVTSSLDTVGLRSPAHPVAQQILKLSSLPLAAPSANQFGRISPTKAEHVLAELGNRLNYCLEGGECDIGLESTICSVDTVGNVTVLRPGGISQGSLQSALGYLFQGMHSELGLPAIISHSPMAPGLLESHYAPRKPMFRIEQSPSVESLEKIKNRLKSDKVPHEKINILTPYILSSEIRSKFLKAFKEITFHHLAESESDSLSGAHHLFTKLRELDQNNADIILCSLPLSTQGLWPAIRDRLTRASRSIS